MSRASVVIVIVALAGMLGVSQRTIHTQKQTITEYKALLEGESEVGEESALEEGHHVVLAVGEGLGEGLEEGVEVEFIVPERRMLVVAAQDSEGEDTIIKTDRWGHVLMSLTESCPDSGLLLGVKKDGKAQVVRVDGEGRVVFSLEEVAGE